MGTGGRPTFEMRAGLRDSEGDLSVLEVSRDL